MVNYLFIYVSETKVFPAPVSDETVSPLEICVLYRLKISIKALAGFKQAKACKPYGFNFLSNFLE